MGILEDSSALANANSDGSGTTVLDMQLKQVQMQQKRQQVVVDNLNKKLKATKDTKSKTRLQTQITAQQKVLTALAQKGTGLQNKIYETTGQYDKLLTGSGRDAFLAISTLFDQYGLKSLAGKIYDYVKNGYSADTVSILLQDTPEYKKRFAANEARKKAGLNVLSPAEYLSIESSYRQIMRQSGLPAGFYDSTDDFTNFIGKDVSPTELQGRVDLATQAGALANQSYKDALSKLGIGQSELAAYFLNPDKALPFLQKTAATAAIGSEALSRGLEFDTQRAGELAAAGVGRDQAAQGFSQIADEFSDLKTIGSIYGKSWTQAQAEQDVFTSGGAATQVRQGLINQERGNFSGSAGAARSGLAGRGGAR